MSAPPPDTASGPVRLPGSEAGERGVGGQHRGRADTHLAPRMLGPKPRVSSEMTVKVKSFYLFQERTRKVDLDISYENRQTENTGPNS